MDFIIAKFGGRLSKLWKRRLLHVPYVALTFLLITLFYYNGVYVILPQVVENETHILIHEIIAHFLLFNILGNLFYGMFTDTSIRGSFLQHSPNEDWRPCLSCETSTPPRSWHCSVCDICILKRDHHCNFFACCIGFKNQRYFVMFLLHTTLTMFYALYFTLQYVIYNVSFSSYLSFFRIFFPLAAVVIDSDEDSIYILLLVVNLVVGAFVLILLFLQIKNMSRGMMLYESNHNISKYNFGWKENWRQVLGDRWYLTWVSPFITSRLGGDGTTFPTKHE